MAKQPSKGGMSRVRFIMVDAEIAEGEFGQIAAAIQSALRPATVAAQRSAPLLTTSTLNGGGEEVVIGGQMESDTENAEDGFVRSPPASKPRRSRKPTTPEVLDVDLISDVSLESFAARHPAEKEPEKNLVVAAWFKEHRDTPAITAAHVYTAYRQLKWPAGFEDFSWPLRYLKKEKLMGAGASRGEYVVNHLGLDRVRKMATSD